MISRIVSNDRCLQILEYNKIIELWADQASTHQGREQILNWHPASEPVEIERALDETAEAVQVIRLYTEFTLGGVYDLRKILKSYLMNMAKFPIRRAQSLQEFGAKRDLFRVVSGTSWMEF